MVVDVVGLLKISDSSACAESSSTRLPDTPGVNDTGNAQHASGCVELRILELRMVNYEHLAHAKLATVVPGGCEGRSERYFTLSERPIQKSSPAWTRTRNLRINSPTLCQLSYRGSRVARADTLPDLAGGVVLSTKPGKLSGHCGVIQFGIIGVVAGEDLPDQWRSRIGKVASGGDQR
jgi:hypothetical protein